jgi:hypothetical protein
MKNTQRHCTKQDYESIKAANAFIRTNHKLLIQMTASVI